MKKMHVDQPHTDETLIRSLLTQFPQFPQWQRAQIQAVASDGTSNALFRLDDKFVARLPLTKSAESHLKKEYWWLSHLAPHLPVAIPSPQCLGAPTKDYPFQWSVCTWIEGKNPTLDMISDINAFAEQLANFILSLQHIATEGGPLSGEQNFYRGVPLIERDALTRQAINKLHDVIDTIRITALWGKLLQTPIWKHDKVWVHGDLAPGNILSSQGNLVGVIDFGGLGVGDPAVDLIIAWNFLTPAAREVFRDAMQVDDATWERGRAWALSIALIQLPYYWDTNPAIVANAQHVIQEVLR